MLPCCGFFYIPNEKLDNATILGCPNGIDWSIHDGKTVVLEMKIQFAMLTVDMFSSMSNVKKCRRVGMKIIVDVVINQ